jgi:hypothetical protein
MSETKHTHTPGPWKIIAEHEDDRDVFARQELLATTYDMNGSQPKAVAEANARLIAAAPELLATLQNVYNYLIGLHAYLLSCETSVIVANLESTSAFAYKTAELCEAAISKAKGVIPVHSHEEKS